MLNNIMPFRYIDRVHSLTSFASEFWIRAQTSAGLRQGYKRNERGRLQHFSDSNCKEILFLRGVSSSEEVVIE
jgi:hypothetical protein